MVIVGPAPTLTPQSKTECAATFGSVTVCEDALALSLPLVWTRAGTEAGLGVGLGAGVPVAVAVAVAVGVALEAGVAVDVGVAVGVGAGVPPGGGSDPFTYLYPAGMRVAFLEADGLSGSMGGHAKFPNHVGLLDR